MVPRGALSESPAHGGAEPPSSPTPGVASVSPREKVEVTHIACSNVLSPGAMWATLLCSQPAVGSMAGPGVPVGLGCRAPGEEGGQAWINRGLSGVKASASAHPPPPEPDSMYRCTDPYRPAQTCMCTSKHTHTPLTPTLSSHTQADPATSL